MQHCLIVHPVTPSQLGSFCLQEKASQHCLCAVTDSVDDDEDDDDDVSVATAEEQT